MTYNDALAGRVRDYLCGRPGFEVREKKMFAGLMCRYDPALDFEVASRPGFEPMVMRGKTLRCYGYVGHLAYEADAYFSFWINLCLDFNSRAKAGKRKAGV